MAFTFLSAQKSESEEADTQKPHVKLRRTVSEAPRPASTPPVIAASGVKEDNDEEKIIAELEVGDWVVGGGDQLHDTQLFSSLTML